MAKKDSGKKIVLPAIGKPKPKSKKTSARDLGKAANSQFKQGYADKTKKDIVDLKGKVTTAQDSAKVFADELRKINKNKNYTLKKRLAKENSGQISTQRKWTRITGV